MNNNTKLSEIAFHIFKEIIEQDNTLTESQAIEKIDALARKIILSMKDSGNACVTFSALVNILAQFIVQTSAMLAKEPILMGVGLVKDITEQLMKEVKNCITMHETNILRDKEGKNYQQSTTVH